MNDSVEKGKIHSVVGFMDFATRCTENYTLFVAIGRMKVYIRDETLPPPQSSLLRTSNTSKKIKTFQRYTRGESQYNSDERMSKNVAHICMYIVHTLRTKRLR